MPTGQVSVSATTSNSRASSDVRVAAKRERGSGGERATFARFHRKADRTYGLLGGRWLAIIPPRSRPLAAGWLAEQVSSRATETTNTTTTRTTNWQSGLRATWRSEVCPPARHMGTSQSPSGFGCICCFRCRQCQYDCDATPRRSPPKMKAKVNWQEGKRLLRRA